MMYWWSEAQSLHYWTGKTNMFEVIVETSKGTRVASTFCSTDVCSIGKDSSNTVVLHGWSIDKHHARLTRGSAGIFVEDLDSRLGLRVNGEKRQRHGPIGERDTILIHDYKIRVRSAAGAASAAPLAISEMEAASPGVTSDGDVPSNSSIPMPAATAPGRPGSTSEPLFKSDSEGGVDDRVMRPWRVLARERLLQQLDLRRVSVDTMSDEELRETTTRLVRDIVASVSEVPTEADRQELIRQVIAEAIGLGPLENLIALDDISEIMVNSHQEIYYERGGKIFVSGVSFTDDKAVQAAIERIVAPLGRRIDESSPMVDARLKDGSRVNAVIPPVALKGPCITIRKFMKERLTAQHLINFGSMSPEMVDFLQISVTHKRNVVISGGTGSGKTTLLNVLSNFIPKHERVITVEDAAELRLNQPNLVSLEARPSNQEGKGAVHIRDLVRNCLRMRPDRIVVGECRGGEALDMLQAMNTGHDGSLTTAHANSPRDCISRLEVMVMMAGMDLPIQAIREQIASAVSLIVQQTRFACGTRKVTSICEVAGVENGRLQLAEIFKFSQTGFDGHGKVQGEFVATGLVPEFYEALHRRGVEVNLRIFDKDSAA